MCSDFRVLTEGRVKGIQIHRFAEANSRTNRKTPIKDGKAENKNKKNLTRDLHKYLVLQNKGKKQQFAKKIDESTGKR